MSQKNLSVTREHKRLRSASGIHCPLLRFSIHFSIILSDDFLLLLAFLVTRCTLNTFNNVRQFCYFSKNGLERVQPFETEGNNTGILDFTSSCLRYAREESIFSEILYSYFLGNFVYCIVLLHYFSTY